MSLPNKLCNILNSIYLYISRFYHHSWYWFRTHTIHRYHIIDIRDKKNGYKWGWIDRDEAMLFACFTLLARYVEKEDPFNTIDWDYDGASRAAANEIHRLYYWWTVERPAAWGKIWNQLKINYTEGAEVKLNIEDKANLQALINIREWLWI